jgi:hypothetical protein
MGLFSKWFKDPRANHSFDEKDRELSAARRRMNIEIENLRKEQEMERLRKEHELHMIEMQAQIDDLVGLDDEYAGGQMSPEDALAMKLIDKIGEKKTEAAPPASTRSYTDDEIANIWSNVPSAHKILVPQCTDEQIKEYVTKQLLPQADADTLQRCVRLARQQR